MRFMVSYEENSSQSRDRCCHPQKWYLPPPSDHNQTSPLLMATLQCDSTCLLWRALERKGSGPGVWQDPPPRTLREAPFQPEEKW